MPTALPKKFAIPKLSIVAPNLVLGQNFEVARVLFGISSAGCKPWLQFLPLIIEVCQELHFGQQPT